MHVTEQRPSAEPAERPWLQIGVLLSVFFALCAATVLLPHDEHIRYRQLLPTIQFQTHWGYQRTNLSDTPIDIALVGNSRLQAAISAPALSRTLSDRSGTPLEVANLAIPQEGRNAHFVVAKRLLESRPETRLLVLSVIEQMPRDGHPAFSQIADAHDVIAAPRVFNRDYLADLAHLPFRQISLFTQSTFPAAFGHPEAADLDGYWGDGFDTTASFTTPTGNYVDRDLARTEAEIGPSAAARIQTITPPLLPNSLADYEFAVERQYVREIAALAEANGTRILFLYLPIYGHPMPVHGRDFYSDYGEILDAGFLASEPGFYSDYGHFGREGSSVATSWLAEQLVEAGMVSTAATAEPEEQND